MAVTSYSKKHHAGAAVTFLVSARELQCGGNNENVMSWIVVHESKRSTRGIEPRTSSTLRKNHTPRPSRLLLTSSSEQNIIDYCTYYFKSPIQTFTKLISYHQVLYFYDNFIDLLSLVQLKHSFRPPFEGGMRDFLAAYPSQKMRATEPHQFNELTNILTKI